MSGRSLHSKNSQVTTNTHFYFSQNNILLRETGLEGGVTATTNLYTWTAENHQLSSTSSGLVSDQTAGSRRWYQPVHPLLSPSAPGSTASAASSWMSTLPEETMTVRPLLTKEKPYSTEILQAVALLLCHTVLKKDCVSCDSLGQHLFPRPTYFMFTVHEKSCH